MAIVRTLQEFLQGLASLFSLGEKHCQETCIHGDVILYMAHFFPEIKYFVLKSF